MKEKAKEELLDLIIEYGLARENQVYHYETGYGYRQSVVDEHLNSVKTALDRLIFIIEEGPSK